MCLKMGSGPSWVHLKRQEVMTIRWVLGYPVFRQTQSTCLIWADDGGSNLCTEERNYTQSNTKLHSHTTMMNDCFYWLVDFSNSWAISIWKKLAGQKRCFLWTIMTCTFETLVHRIIWPKCGWPIYYIYIFEIRSYLYLYYYYIGTSTRWKRVFHHLFLTQICWNPCYFMLFPWSLGGLRYHPSQGRAPVLSTQLADLLHQSRRVTPGMF